MSDEAAPILEIHDPALHEEAIIRQVQQQVAQRRAEGAYGPDPATLGPESLRPVQPGSPPDSSPADLTGLLRSLAELTVEGELHEPDFVSSAPLVAPLIVAVRRLWNWMSTKWYMRPILRQQSDVNAQVALAISDLARWNESDAHRLLRLECKVAELEARLNRLEAETES